MLILLLLPLSLCQDDSVHYTTSVALEATAGTSVGWDMEKIFQDQQLSDKQIISYQILGDAPCLVQDPFLFMNDAFSYESQHPIIDFAIAKDYLFYITKSELVRVDIKTMMSNPTASIAKLYDISSHNFDYLDVFVLPDNATLILFKNDSANFFYLIVPYGVAASPVLTPIHQSFENFTLDMKAAVWGEYLFIPGGSEGLFVYKYTGEVMEFKKKLKFTDDVSDITVKYFENVRSLYVFVVNRKLGVMAIRMRTDIMDIDDIKRVREFAKAKSVNIVPGNESDRILVITEGLDNTSQFYLLDLFVDKDVGFIYDDIKLLDGNAQYGDANSKYAVVLMPNSVLVTEINRKSNNMMKYLDSKEANHAKLYDTKGLLGIWLFYAHEANLIAKRILSHTGFLLCDIKDAESYTFVVSASSHQCGRDSYGRAISACYYDANVTVKVNALGHKESYENVMRYGVLIGVFVGIIVMLLVAVIVVTLMCYKKVQTQLLELTGKGENAKVDATNDAPQELEKEVQFKANIGS
eukprot:TRINITY_DN1077_c0_g2_i1.p1 TRINITY_DN1077_c0_g2~~TRINITY_DN1077_c0_g2_i1.p1  ORF type:complete len:523 (+),score=158.27 TRINITY_DN1077_c0_g2_i1:936-2504(+)